MIGLRISAYHHRPSAGLGAPFREPAGLSRGPASSYRVGSPQKPRQFGVVRGPEPLHAIGDADVFEGTERFSVRRRLGAGSFGTVYEAFDRERGTPVALKVLRQTDPAAIYRFKKEFRALADVTHPNLVELFELMSDGARWFFTMELIDGVPFLSCVRGHVAPGTETLLAMATAEREAIAAVDTVEHRIDVATLAADAAPDWDRLRALFLQLAEGLSALHAAGRVHRDIKPGNVMVSREGRVVILDFGLVAELTPQTLDRSSGLHAVGTPAYMSPEQARGLVAGAASDWYSLGVILYEALTGALPFHGDMGEILARKQHEDPVPPRQLVPGVPGDLDRLSSQLLRRRPEDRPSGPEVLRRLRGGDGATPSPVTRSRSSRPTPFVGRREQLAALHEAFTRSHEGHVVVVLVRGRSGMGKSTLVRLFLRELAEREPGAIVLSGRCYERESMPYKALDSLIDALSQHLRALPARDVEALLPRDVLTLARLFPVLKRVEAVSQRRRRGPEPPDSQELRRRAVAALRELFVRIADRASLVLFIDDLQWGDADSAALLSEILRPPDAPPLLLIGCRRGDARSEAESGVFLPAPAAPAEENSLSTPEELFVDPFTAEESEELARNLLGGSPVAAGTAHAIALESQGNPLFLDELAHSWLSEEGVDRSSKPLTLQELIARRIAHLPDEARVLLEVVAVAGEPVERSVALRAAEIESGAAEALTILQARRLIRSHRTKGRDALETTHDQIRESVVRGLSPGTAKLRHARLARALEAWGQADPEAVAIHFSAAEELETAAEYVRQAARQASTALAFDRAARLYRAALNLGAPETEERALRVALGDALANAGRGAEAAEAFSTAARGANAADRLELQRRAADQLLRSGHIDRGLAAIREVLGSVGMKLAGGPVRALLSLLLHRAWIRVRGLRFQERDASQVAAERLMKIDVCWTVAAGVGLVDTIRGNDFQARQLLLALQAGEPYRVARALALEVVFSAITGGRGRQRTERVQKVASSLATRIGHPHAIGLVTFTSGFAAYLEGRWRTALELLDRAEVILRERCTGVAWELGNTRYEALRALVYMGRFDELSRRFPSYLKDARLRGDLYVETSLRARIACPVLLVLDRPDKARQELREALARWSKRAFHLQHYYDLFGEVEIDLYEGNVEAAWERLLQGWPAFRRSLLPRVQYLFVEWCHLHARAVLAGVASGKLPPQRLGLALRDARSIQRARMPWADPFADLIRASVAASSGDRPAALALLASAESGFEATDTGLYAAAARFQRGE
ncbi:MAG TPA: AAA family ATPase, partial [Thermoanaerobaculia bacterium]|nr:AAA family ATPase [Thermoanaerobaculia bacterium]